jgi:protein O-mannosyl-transferase
MTANALPDAADRADASGAAAAPAARGATAPSPGTGALLVALVAVAASWNVLLNGFVWDDHQNILQNRWVREPGRVWEALSHHLGAFDPSIQSSYYRPVMHLVFAGTNAVAGLRPWAFHLVNLLVHAATSACVYLILARWAAPGPPAAAGVPAPADRGWEALASGPLVAGLLFAVHPVHTQAVAWNAGIVDMSYSLLALVAFLLATWEGRSRLVPLAAAPAVLLAALLAKEPAVMVLPVVAVAFALRGALTDRVLRRDALARLGALSVAVAAYLPLRVNALGGLMGGGASRVRIGLADGAATALVLVADYLELMVAPVRLSALRDFQIVPRLLDPRALAALALLVAFALLVLALRRRPSALLGAALFLFPLLPALYVPVLGDNAGAERYAYLPSAGAALLLSAGVDSLRGRGALARAGIAVAAAVALLWATAATLAQNAVWRDDVTLWADTAGKVPSSGRAHEALGGSLLGVGRTPEAIAALWRAVDLLPAEAAPRVNLASALIAAGRVDEGLAAAEAGARALPAVAEAQAILGSALAAKGRFAEAVGAYDRALSLNPSLAAIHNGAAIAWVELGRRDRALVHLREAVRLEPENRQFAENLALLSGP